MIEYSEWFIRCAVYVIVACDALRDKWRSKTYEISFVNDLHMFDFDFFQMRKTSWLKWHAVKWLSFLGAMTIIETHFVSSYWWLLIDVTVTRILWRTLYDGYFSWKAIYDMRGFVIAIKIIWEWLWSDELDKNPWKTIIAAVIVAVIIAIMIMIMYYCIR